VGEDCEAPANAVSAQTWAWQALGALGAPGLSSAREAGRALVDRWNSTPRRQGDVRMPTQEADRAGRRREGGHAARSRRPSYLSQHHTCGFPAKMWSRETDC